MKHTVGHLRVSLIQGSEGGCYLSNIRCAGGCNLRQGCAGGCNLKQECVGGCNLNRGVQGVII